MNTSSSASIHTDNCFINCNSLGFYKLLISFQVDEDQSSIYDEIPHSPYGISELTGMMFEHFVSLPVCVCVCVRVSPIGRLECGGSY